MTATTMNRQQAIELVARADFESLSAAERESLLLDYWSIDETDPAYETLPEPLRQILEGDAEPEDPADSKYDPLVLLACREAYAGVLNGYLERRLGALGHDTRVLGAVEPRERCPCCGYLTLEQRGMYEICPVCFWEDDGGEEPDRVSVPNRQTLRDARESFARIGAVSESALTHVLADGRERYALEAR